MASRNFSNAKCRPKGRCYHKIGNPKLPLPNPESRTPNPRSFTVLGVRVDAVQIPDVIEPVIHQDLITSYRKE